MRGLDPTTTSRFRLGGMETYRITELARRFDLARSTLLHYDHIGLLRPGGRTGAGYRVYTGSDLARLERICAFREAGLGLSDIALLLDRDGAEAGILERRMREIGQEVASLRAQQRVLAGLLRTCAVGEGDAGLDQELWLDLRKACGLDREGLVRWHREFERRSPQGHHDFLLGLGLSESEAVHIRLLTKNVEGNREAMDRFDELFDELPRQGPGSDESTARALGLAKGLPARPRVLDLACGSGRPTRILARRLGAVLAIDSRRPLLDRLARDAALEGLEIETREISLFDMPFEEESFDLVWAEGALFILGLARGLAEIRPLLARGGILAFTEMCLFEADPPSELMGWFDEVYPDVKTVDQVRALALEAGYEPVGDFRLPDGAWWDDYYTPMLERIEVLKTRNAGSPKAQEVYARCEREARMHREHSKSYGYQFFVLGKGSAK